MSNQQNTNSNLKQRMNPLEVEIPKQTLNIPGKKSKIPLEQQNLLNTDISRDVSPAAIKAANFMKYKGFLQNLQQTLISGILNMFTMVDYNLPIFILKIFSSIYSNMEVLAGSSYTSTFYNMTIFSILFGLMDSVGTYTA